VLEGNLALNASPGCCVEKVNPDGIECRLGSGMYQFQFINLPSRLSGLK